MSSLDLYEDGFPHGTKEGYDRGCRSGACPNAFEGEPICREAFLRYQGDYAYRKAVDAGETPPPPVTDEQAKRTKLSAAGSVITEPTVHVADSYEPLPVLEMPRPTKQPKAVPSVEAAEPKPKRVRRSEWQHGTITGYTNHGCRKDNECPEFLAGGKSCRLAAREYWRDRAAEKKRGQGLAPSEIAEPDSSDVISAIASNTDVDVMIDRLPDGALRVTIRIPASVVAA